MFATFLTTLTKDFDLEAGYDYLLNRYEFIDAEKTVALGASYGGYMVLYYLFRLCVDKLDSRTQFWAEIQSPRLVIRASILLT